MYRYGCYRRTKSDLGFVHLAGEAADPPAFDGPCGLGGAEDAAPLSGEGFRLFCLDCCSVFFKMVRRRRHRKIKIKFSLFYPRSGGVPSADGGRVELCVRPIYWDPVRFRVRLCGYRPVSSDLCLSSLTMVAALMRWSFEALARRLPSVYYNKLYLTPAREG